MQADLDGRDRDDGAPAAAQRTVLKNALFSSIAQVASLPLSILLNASMARYLGPVALGYMYVASTFNSFGFLAVDWGLNGALPALVATDRSKAGRLLGSALAWKCGCAAVVSVSLYILTTLLGYGPEARQALALLSVGYLASSVVNACQDTVVGFERTDVSAIRQFGEQLSSVLIVVPIMMLGGTLAISLVGCIVPTVLMGGFVWWSLTRMGVERLSFERDTLKMLLRRGAPFVFLNLTMALQPNIDAIFLSKLAPADVVGWHAAARKLIGLLVFPASALIGALYPTLCRLYASDEETFLKTAASALRGTALIVMPIALGCALYPDIGIAIYGSHKYAPAAGNLRIMAILLFLMYFTMPLSTALLAANRQRAWALVQSVCLLVSVVLDPILVPFFQRRTGNGGLGICTAAVVSEILVLAIGAYIAPRGLFGGAFWRSVIPVVPSGVAMVVVALLLRGLSSYVASPIAIAAYVVVLRLTGGLDDALLEAGRNYFKRKVSSLRARLGST